MLTLESSRDCSYCRRRRIFRKSNAGSLFAWGSGFLYGFFGILPMLGVITNADGRRRDDAPDNVGFIIFSAILMLVFLVVIPTVLIGGGILYQRQQVWRCERCGTVKSKAAAAREDMYEEVDEEEER